MQTKLITGALLLFATLAAAQEYKVNKSSGRLEIYSGNVTVEGHAGNEIIFSSKDGDRDKDERAVGLKSVNGMGLDDNTGLGINVTTKDNIVEVRQLKKMNSPKIKVLVPKGVIVYFNHESQYGGKAVFRNMENEIEISCQYNSIELENVTGPLTLKTVYGGVDASFSESVKGPLSIVSVYGHVDITLPVATKANLRMTTSYGELYMASEFNLEVNKKDGMTQWGDKLDGKLNGGGSAIDLRSDYGKIYLRKK
jgi:predicted membrane protein